MWWPFSQKEDDPLDDIDPTLVAYLKTQAPKTYNPSSSKDALPTQSPPSNRSWFGPGLTSSDPAPAQEIPKVPKASLFQDGRYAHLWKTYRPLAEQEAASQTDQDRLNDVIGGFNQRRSDVKAAALENCSMEQWRIHECFKSGKWEDQMTMCKAQNRALSRCVMLQSKFLRALGYLAPYERSAEEDEKIQMHAYTLYHRMLDQERQIEEAKKRGGSIPEFPPMIRILQDGQLSPEMNSDEVRPRIGAISYETLPQEVRDKLEDTRLKDLNGLERELEQHALNQEIVTYQALRNQINTVWRQQRKERLDRQEAGEERISDKIMRMFDFREYRDDAGETKPSSPSSKP